MYRLVIGSKIFKWETIANISQVNDRMFHRKSECDYPDYVVRTENYYENIHIVKDNNGMTYAMSKNGYVWCEMEKKWLPFYKKILY